MSTPEALEQIAKTRGRFFRVAFRRKTKGKNGEPAGSVREMVCRLRVRKFSSQKLPPGVRASEDAAASVLTVWDVEAFHSARREGKPLRAAGQAAYRRINMAEVVSLG